MSIKEGWGPTGQPNPSREQRIDMIRHLLQQEKADGGQVLLYPGKNRTLVVLSNNNDVYVIAEAHDG